MTNSARILALLIAASAATQGTAQDMSRFLDPEALAADLGLNGGTYAVAALEDMTAPRAEVMASLNPQVSGLAPLRSLVPVPRGGSMEAVARLVPASEIPMEQMMAEARAAAPDGANVAVIVSSETVVVNGQVMDAEVAEQDSPSWWRRIFGG